MQKKGLQDEGRAHAKVLAREKKKGVFKDLRVVYQDQSTKYEDEAEVQRQARKAGEQ